MDSLLYENAMQVVPVLVIAVFIDGGTSTADQLDERTLRRHRTQNRLSAVTALTAFMLSMLVVARVVPPSSGTLAVVVSAIGGTVGLLLVRIWRRLDEAVEPPSQAQPADKMTRTGQPEAVRPSDPPTPEGA